MSINSEDDYTRDIQSILRELNAIDYERETKGLDSMFTSVQEIVDEIFQVTKGLEGNPNSWMHLKAESEDSIKRFLFDFLRIIRKMQKFVPVFNTGVGTREEITEEMRRFYKIYSEDFLPRMRGAIAKIPNPHATEIKVEQLEQDLAALRKDKEELAASQGVSRFTDVFGKEAERNKKAADGWLTWAKAVGGIIAFLLVVGVIFVLYLWWCQIQMSTPIFLHLMLAKVLLVSFLLIVFYQAVGNYNRNMHLHTLNRHRKNSIDSFEAFFKATQESEARDAILTQATKAIFEASDTGYVSSRGRGNMTGIETIRIADQTKE